MDNILKSFPFALIFRGAFPGGFFVISYVVASKGWKELENIGDKLLTVWLPLAIFVGVIAYVFHRSVIYPFIEFFFDGKITYQSHRRCSPIRKTTIRRALYMWSIGENSPEVNIARHLVAWNDYVHLQYTSALCTILGTICGAVYCCNCGGNPGWIPYTPLIALAVLLVVGGAVSHWRLCFVADQFEYDYPRKLRSTSHSK